MKISNSKKQLAKIISENGGWQSGKFCAQQDDGEIWFSKCQPRWNKGQGTFTMHYENHITAGYLIANRHQTILSRAEYLHLYPAQDFDEWIEWKGGECPIEVGSVVDVKHRDGDIGIRCHAGLSSSEPDSEGGATAEDWSHLNDGGDIIAYRLHKPNLAETEFCESVTRSIPEPEAKPSIEQLAEDYRNAKDCAERKQEEADAAKVDAEAKLAELIAAGKEVGLVSSVAAPEPELVITGWRDLRVGDIIQAVPFGDARDDTTRYKGGWADSSLMGKSSILSIGRKGEIEIDSDNPFEPRICTDEGIAFRFICRP